MSNLKCHDYGCSNNYCTHCIRDVVLISNNAYCRSYMKRDTNGNTSLKDFEFAIDRGLSLKTDEHDILCTDEDCKNNEFGLCKAKNIRIDECQSGPKCVNYRPKK